MMATIEFQYPLMLCLIAVPWLFMGLARLRLSVKKQFVDKHLLPWVQSARYARRSLLAWTGLILYCCMWILFALAMAGPRALENQTADDYRQSVDIMIIVDVSPSMRTEDIKPNRLSRAKSALVRLIEQTRGDRIGLVLFSGKSLLLAPLSRDKSLINFYVGQIDAAMFPVPGSDLLGALTLAQKQFDRQSRRPKAVLIISDGAQPLMTQQQSLLKYVNSLYQKNIIVYSLGVGTLRGGAVLSENGQWLRYKGQTVISPLAQDFLKALAQTGGGVYARLSEDDSDINAVYKNGIANQASYRIAAEHQQQLQWVYYYQYPLIAAVLIFILLSLVRFDVDKRASATTAGKFVDAQQHASIKQHVSISIMLLLAFFLVACSEQEKRQQLGLANASYQAKNYQQAQLYFSGVHSYSGKMGAGASAYRRQKYSRAASFFSAAFRLAKTDKQRAMALFNLANSFFYAKDYQVAISIYKDALKYDSAHVKAGINLQITRQVYARLKSNSGFDHSITSRVGKGPQFRRALPDLKIDRGGAGLDNQNRDKVNNNNQYHYDPATATDISSNALLGSSKNRDSNQAVANPTVHLQAKAGLNLYFMQQQLMNKQYDSSFMWQRLFFFDNKLFIPPGELYYQKDLQPW